nr:MAG TPA: hypothetical protein [Caudoviricetes sp.]
MWRLSHSYINSDHKKKARQPYCYRGGFVDGVNFQCVGPWPLAQTYFLLYAILFVVTYYVVIQSLFRP